MNDAGAGREVAKAVLIAALSALAAKLIEWGVDELKARIKKTSDAEVELKEEDDAKLSKG